MYFPKVFPLARYLIRGILYMISVLNHHVTFDPVDMFWIAVKDAF